MRQVFPGFVPSQKHQFFQVTNQNAVYDKDGNLKSLGKRWTFKQMEQLVSHLEKKTKLDPYLVRGGEGRVGKRGREERRGGEETEKLDTMKDNMNNFLYNL